MNGSENSYACTIFFALVSLGAVLKFDGLIGLLIGVGSALVAAVCLRRALVKSAQAVEEDHQRIEVQFQQLRNKIGDTTSTNADAMESFANAAQLVQENMQLLHTGLIALQNLPRLAENCESIRLTVAALAESLETISATTVTFAESSEIIRSDVAALVGSSAAIHSTVDALAESSVAIHSTVDALAGSSAAIHSTVDAIAESSAAIHSTVNALAESSTAIHSTVVTLAENSTAIRSTVAALDENSSAINAELEKLFVAVKEQESSAASIAALKKIAVIEDTNRKNLQTVLKHLQFVEQNLENPAYAKDFSKIISSVDNLDKNIAELAKTINNVVKVEEPLLDEQDLELLKKIAAKIHQK